MKTSLQELIHYIEHKGELDKETLLNKAKSLLEKEKNDLIDACQKGINKALDYSFEPQDYYNQTFKQ
jgi:hypothetical protein